MTDDERSFEDLQRELDGIVAALERGDVAIDEALALWQRGDQLYRLCLARLDVAQGRIDELATEVRDTDAADR